MVAKKPGGAATHTATCGVWNKKIDKTPQTNFQVLVFEEMDKQLADLKLLAWYRENIAAIAGHVRAPHGSSDACAACPGWQFFFAPPGP